MGILDAAAPPLLLLVLGRALSLTTYRYRSPRSPSSPARRDINRYLPRMQTLPASVTAQTYCTIGNVRVRC